MNRAFKTFSIDERMKDLEQYNFTNQNVAIIVPTVNQNGHWTPRLDEALYDTQRKDASKLLHYIASKLNNVRVCILRDGDEANETNKKFDNVIFLHEFTTAEQEYVRIGLCENSPNLKMIELY